MVKARYIGVDDGDILSGKVYKISTVCSNGYLVVTARNSKLKYKNLEQFLKSWKVEAVYHG